MAKDDAEPYGDQTELADEPPSPRVAVPVTRTPTVTPSDTWADDPWDRTSHAREGAQLAHAIEARLSRWQPAAGTARRVVVEEPEERTGGGARARLPIAVTSAEHRWGATVVGWVDAAASTIELRAHATLSAQHRARFGQGWDVTLAEYERLVRELAHVAREHRLELRVAEGGASALDPPEAEVPRWVWVALGVLVGVALAWVTVRM